MTGESLIDVDFYRQAKAGQVVAGDVFLSRKIKEEGRVITVLSEGLGSGVKAGVLANLTATMALHYNYGVRGRAAECEDHHGHDAGLRIT